MVFFKKFGFWLFSIIAVADLFFIGTGLQQYRYFSKPLLLPLLLVAILAHIGFKRHLISRTLIIGALVAGTLGDLLLIDSDRNVHLFAYGLASFLVMQVLYLVYFLRVQPFRKDTLISNLVVATLLYICVFFMIRFLSPFLGELKIAVIIYAVVIAVMFLAATNLYHSRKVFKLAVRYFIPGATFLMVSDAILAFNKFYFKEEFFDILIMSTYLAGQLLLALGFTKHLRRHRHSSTKSHAQNTEEEMLLLD